MIIYISIGLVLLFLWFGWWIKRKCPKCNKRMLVLGYDCNYVYWCAQCAIEITDDVTNLNKCIKCNSINIFDYYRFDTHLIQCRDCGEIWRDYK